MSELGIYQSYMFFEKKAHETQVVFPVSGAILM